MATKTLSIKEDVYNRLKALKRENESFSDVVDRVTKGREDYREGFGAWKGTDLKENIEENREEIDKDFEEREDAFV